MSTNQEAKVQYHTLALIEKTIMPKECEDLDYQETVMLYTHNQFARDFQNMMDNVES